VQREEKVARVARRQKGLVTHQQALACGMTAETVRHRVETGAWSEIRRGVYIVGGAPPTWEQTLLAVTLPFEDCWIDLGTAARLWDMRHAPEVDAIEVLRPYGRYRRLDGVIAHRSRIIVPSDVTHHRGIPVTSRARTIVDCSARLDVAQTGKLIDDAMRVDKRTLEEVRACFVRLSSGGRRRRRSIRSALMFRIPGYDPGESDLELVALRTIIAAGLPIPVQQHRIVLNGKRCRIDLAYPDLKIAIELQSWSWHGGRESFDDDKARMSDLTAIGWRTLEITSRHSPEDIVRWVTATRARAAA
jgi:Transcriptional regulator, AbiEi antitoxin